MVITKSCAYCHRPAAYARPTDKTPLCIAHFNELFVKRVARTISKYKMLKYDDRIGVGLSGGKDSVTLLHVLHKLHKRFPKSELVAIIIDEGIEGYREEGLRIAIQHAKNLDIEYHVRSFKEYFGYELDVLLDTLGERKVSRKLAACGYCGIMRRQSLNNAARELEVDVLATGHNLDDEAQTVLMNMMRGDLKKLVRFNGLRRKVHEDLVPRIKPLRLTPEQEIILYAIFNRLEYQETPCPHSVEANRGPVRRFLTEYLHEQPNASLNLLYAAEKISAILQTANRIVHDHPSILEEYGLSRREKSEILSLTLEQEFTKRCKICGQPTNNEICKMCEVRQELEQVTHVSLSPQITEDLSTLE